MKLEFFCVKTGQPIQYAACAFLIILMVQRKEEGTQHHSVVVPHVVHNIKAHKICVYINQVLAVGAKLDVEIKTDDDDILPLISVTDLVICVAVHKHIHHFK